MKNCLFCKFASGEFKVDKVFENKSIIVFNDIDPRAPIHLLIIPRIHIPTLNDIDKSNNELLGEMSLVASQLAKKHGMDKDGYRTIMNCNHFGGQTIFHIHLHLLGGRKLKWPPG